ncbi:L-2-hydroxyglutarate oxidase [Rhodococcus sp. BP-252]|uniref:L-2-hydroxyglutarate oxidase n=1 Tax=unclassified Rhodococcus (in: high G+C Gram-positive bacteria) TaxID=192944 RepID=UPI001C9B7FDC|nr:MULTISPECIES: L-2-hydroxyglutarate oxidase [unclassified Rhodococcus (in: high G+C Gram-positive bacteria)]MBY6414147.1 L-2-hydroxyglutarate oxidase [Rhodococcus sp. BP-320]MBY6418878.1 L-2-hydroxyglutarate oxidase [Rhodococcus sp. BP-321]MBY6423575.1 L-2-hydroxyglutarate oxidase [Rhodococcus sp. BP-324]MBY6428912.1 L-2-hydroxyglutarate oxidase [Rhodococcus sp. BP-323]MBY6433917.1 L-2-hydroxyglutarate oxidase [Rhodococcus sp. BP-322]
MARSKVAVVGGGIIGLAVARELMRSRGVEVTVFEKEASVGAHQTGHNSGVVHAGLYYEPGSLKARLCRRGVALLEEFVAEKGVAFDKCGKIVVAHTEDECRRLDAIHERALANGVPGVKLIEAEDIRAIEPHARGRKALHSPETAIVDYPGMTRALAEDITALGGQIRLRTAVTDLAERPGGVDVQTRSGADRFDRVIACAGLQSDRLAVTAGESSFPKIVPFYGDYFLLSSEKSALVNGLIYPVPDPKYPFLGVHVSKTIQGDVTLGPNAFLSLGRESYDRRTLSPKDVADAIGFPGFWRFAARNIPAAVRETRTALSTRVFVEQARRYVPAISVEDVRRGPRGIRAQAMNRDGSLEDDFVITGSARILHVRNAPSPGATSSLAIAEHVVHEAYRRGE